MNKISFSFLTAAAAAIGFFAGGCGEPRPVPPMERMELTARFFRSIEEKRSEQAIRQGRKLLAMDPDSSYIISLISLQEANDIIKETQDVLDKGDISRALDIVRQGRQRHPENRTFSAVYPQVYQLRNAGKLFKSLAGAKNASSMRGARIAVRAGLSRNMTPELDAFLSEYELRGAAMAAKEKADSIAAERAAQEAALKAKKDEATRKAENAQFIKETTEKHAEGERLRTPFP